MPATVDMRGPFAAVRQHPWLLSLLLVAVACAVSIAYIDRPLAVYYRREVDPETVAGFRFIGHLGLSFKYWVGLPILVVVFGVASSLAARPEMMERLQRYANAAFYILLSLAASAIPVYTLKFVLGRFRPLGFIDEDHFGLLPLTAGYLNSSFPSGHSQAIWAIATALVLAIPRYDAAYVITAVLVSYSRVVTYDHYLSDVIAGSTFGIAAAFLVKRQVFDRLGMPVRIGV